MNEVSKVTTKPTGAGAIAGKEILVDGVWKATVVERFVPGCVAAIERELNPAAATPAPLEIGSPTDPDKNPDKVSGSPASPAATPITLCNGKPCAIAGQLDKQLADKERECADLRRDAERYRWLRKHLECFKENVGFGADEYTELNLCTPDILGLHDTPDAAIDAAIKGEGK